MQIQTIANNCRLEQIPVLHVRGSSFTVGYCIGRTFKCFVHDLLSKWQFYQTTALVKYNTPDGKLLYEKALSICNAKFPKYVEELQGMAAGADLPFYQLFILHVDSLMMYPPCNAEKDQIGAKGCTSILSNNEELVLGHTEDADGELLNNIYFICAEIIDETGNTLEKFTTLTYAGHLPGYTMGFNHHGMVYSVNTLYPTDVYPEGTPRAFIARSLLNAANLQEAMDILRDKGNGIADGLSVNLLFSKEMEMHNIEVGPATAMTSESAIDLLTLKKGDTLAHCNRYLRLKIPENHYESSICRHNAIAAHGKPTTGKEIRNILSDQTNSQFSVFRCDNKYDATTVAVGIFEIHQHQWKIYIGKPNASEPVATIPLPF